MACLRIAAGRYGSSCAAERTLLAGVSSRVRAGTEPLQGHLYQRELANHCPKHLGELSLQAVRALKRMRRRSTLIMAFCEQANLFPW
jgi:hypothetical protein